MENGSYKTQQSGTCSFLHSSEFDSTLNTRKIKRKLARLDIQNPGVPETLSRMPEHSREVFPLNQINWKENALSESYLTPSDNFK